MGFRGLTHGSHEVQVFGAVFVDVLSFSTNTIEGVWSKVFGSSQPKVPSFKAGCLSMRCTHLLKNMDSEIHWVVDGASLTRSYKGPFSRPIVSGSR